MKINLTPKSASNENQYEYHNHDRIIVLNNGDLLRISGRSATNAGCGGSQGNGYGLVIYPPAYSGNYYDNIKLAVFPYYQFIDGTYPRNFGNWSTSNEIAWNGGSSMFSCYPLFGSGPSLTGFTGTFLFSVLP